MPEDERALKSKLGFPDEAGDPSLGPVATVPPAFTWASQVKQYPKIGPRGITVFEGHLDAAFLAEHRMTKPVLCLCWRDDRGLLRGVLNYYQEDSPWEKKGNANTFVDPEWYRKGIGTALLTDGVKRWRIDLRQQRYTVQGAGFVRRLIEKGEAEWPTPVNPQKED